MTLSTSTSRVAYATNGTTGPFSIPFYFLANSHLQVVYTTSAGVESTLVLDTDYTVSGAGDSSGGTVTTTTAYPAGGSLTIIRAVPATQETDYADQDAFAAETHETALDKLTMLAQQVDERMDRAIILSVGTTGSGALPSIADRANKYLSFDSNGDVTATAPSTGTALELAADLLAAGATDGAAMVGFLQSGAGAVGRTVQNKLRTDIDPKDFGAVMDGATDDTVALEAAITAASATVGTTQGNEVLLPQGALVTSTMVTLPNRVRIRGKNKRGSSVMAAPGFSDSYLFNAVNGVSSMFDCHLENVYLDCNDVAGVGGVLADAWQEGGGLRSVLINKFRTYGVLIQNGYGGAAILAIRDAEIFGSTAAAATAGIKVSQISAIGNFVLNVSDSTIAGGGAGNELPRGIDMVKDSLHCNAVHFEDCTTGIYLDGVGHHVLTGVTGNSTVTNLVEIAATFNGTLTMLGCQRGGSTNFLKDNRAGGLGTIASYDYPVLTIGQDSQSIRSDTSASAWCVFDGTTAGTNAPVAGFNVTNVIKNGTGDWTVTLTRPMKSLNCAAFMSHNVATNGAHERVVQVSTTTVRLYLYVAGVATDSSEVKFIAFGG